MNAHTPGPWRASAGTGYVAIMAGPTIDRQLAITMTCNPEGCANARLIAAAPDLLAALERLEAGVRLWISRGVSDEDMAAARAAIAKARGEA